MIIVSSYLKGEKWQITLLFNPGNMISDFFSLFWSSSPAPNRPPCAHRKIACHKFLRQQQFPAHGSGCEGVGGWFWEWLVMWEGWRSSAVLVGKMWLERFAMVEKNYGSLKVLNNSFENWWIQWSLWTAGLNTDDINGSQDIKGKALKTSKDSMVLLLVNQTYQIKSAHPQLTSSHQLISTIPRKLR
jgi:hypothetical protein